jgi:hypothetical protein
MVLLPIYMRIQESEFRIQKKNKTMVILAPGSCILMHSYACAGHGG